MRYNSYQNPNMIPNGSNSVSNKMEIQDYNENINKQQLQARFTVLDVLLDIFKNKRPLDVSFERHSKELNFQDKKFSFAMLNFFLRNAIAIDAVIDEYMERPFKANSVERQILRIGLTQLFFMESVEEFACIHTSVDLAKVRVPGADKVINGVLKILEKKK